MFGRSRPVVIDTYGSRRAKKRVPRWLVLLLFGLAAGVAGTIYVQERHLPPRLTAAESTRLRTDLGQTEAERGRLEQELARTSKELEAALADVGRLTDDLTTSNQAAARLRDDVDFLVAALPPDPRGGAVEIRAARFRSTRNALEYEIALAQPGRGKAQGGQVELVVSGDSARAGPTTVTLDPVALPATGIAVVRGKATLPEGFVPSQCAVRVLDRPGGQLLGTRLLYVGRPSS
jgi:hypothetical protein